MGLHTGEGRLGGDNYVGLDVHRAARIAAAGHGGQVLLSSTTRTLVAASLPPGIALRDLGAHRLKDFDEPESLAQLVIEGLADQFPPLRTPEPPTNLPAGSTNLIGRDDEAAEVIALLRGRRLVTLTGPGGVGKTRLATRVAAELRSTFADGSFFVNLAPLRDPALVGPTIARALGLTEQATRPIVDQLKAYLEQRELLLVLDNLEQLPDASGFVGELGEDASRVKLLVTSRSRLGLYGEQEFEVPPLALPERTGRETAEQLSRSDAVALFVERAQAVTPRFRLTDSNAQAVADICARLDGLPLAIELAASRVRLLEPAEILSRLDHHQLQLTSAATNVPARQRTLRNAIDWSYELLAPAEQTLFQRLAHFAGGFTLDAAEAVCNPGSELEIDTLDGIGAFVQQSLLKRSASDGESRFTMLETIRDYGLNRLSASGEAPDIARRHLAFFRDLAEQAEPHFLEVDQARWSDRFDSDHDNVRRALNTSLEVRDADAGLRLGAALWRFWLVRGSTREGREWLERLLTIEPSATPSVRAHALLSLGGLTYWLSDVDATERAYRSAVALYRGIGDRQGEAEALYDLAYVPVMRTQLEQSRAAFEANLTLAREVGRPDLAARDQVALGSLASIFGDHSSALPMLEAAVRFLRTSGNAIDLAWAMASIGSAHRRLGHYPQALEATREALRVNRALRNEAGGGAVLEQMAGLETSLGRYSKAVRLLGATAALRDRTGSTPPSALTQVGDIEGAGRAALGNAAYESIFMEGRAMSMDDAIEHALAADDGDEEPARPDL